MVMVQVPKGHTDQVRKANRPKADTLLALTAGMALVLTVRRHRTGLRPDTGRNSHQCSNRNPA